VLIFGNLGAPALGVHGAGIASALSTVVGFSIYVWLGLRHAREAGFLQRAPSRASVAALFRLSLPSSIQQLFFSAGFVVMFWILGQVGTREMAAATVILNLTLVALLPRPRPRPCGIHAGRPGARPWRRRGCLALGLGRDSHRHDRAGVARPAGRDLARTPAWRVHPRP
jgi:hypothetical protein